MRVGENGLDAEPVEFLIINSPFFICPIMDEGFTVSKSTNQGEKRQVVYVDTRVGLSMDFFFESDEP